jgi:predicted ATPase
VERARLLRAQAASGFAAKRAARRRWVEWRSALHGEQGTIKPPAAISERAYGSQPTQKRRPDSPGTAFIQSVRPEALAICAGFMARNLPRATFA